MMGRLQSALRRLLGLVNRSQRDADLSEELNSHLEAHIADNLRAGMTPDEATRRARAAFGGFAQTADGCRDQHTVPFLEKTMQDLRYAVRMLVKTPGFSLVAIVTLALGIGANTAIFSLISAVLLRPLPFPDADRLMLVWDDVSAQTNGRFSTSEPTPADYATWKDQSRSFTDMAALMPASYNLTGSGEPLKLNGIRTTANLFAVLGMQPLVGRTLTPADDRPDANAVVVLDERIWRSAFGSDPGVVDRTILLNGLPHTIVGVVPPDFPFPVKDTALWVPARFTPQELAVRTSYVLDVVARLKPAVDPRAAQVEMTAIAARISQQFPGNRGVGVTITPLHEHLTRGAKPAMTMLIGAVVLVLLIACVNVANLLLARAATREKELAVRKALGAANTRVVRQLLTESAVLAAVGAVLGIALSTLTFRYLERLIPASLPFGTEPALNVPVLLFSAVVTSLVVLVFGAGPAIVASRVPLDTALKSGAARGTSMSGSRRVHHALVVAEISLTIVLLVAAGLLLRSYANVLAVPPGFQTSRLLIAETVLSPSKYGEVAARSAFYGRVLDRVRALPGVTAAGYVNYPPLTFKGGRGYFSIEGEPPPQPEDVVRHLAIDRSISPGYLQTLGVPLVQGRYLDERDADGAPVAVIVNQKYAAAYWPNQSPIGRRIVFGVPNSSAPTPWLTVVGVVGNVRQIGLDTPTEPEVYFSANQLAFNAPFLWPQNLVVRTAGDPLTLAAAVRHAVSEVDPNQPLSNMRTMDQVFAADVLDRNTQMTLVTVFAVLALVMASVGLYGVLSYTVTRRLPEIGVRMALGARRATVVLEIVRGALRLAAVGIVLGAVSAFAATRLLISSLFGVNRTDPATFAVMSLLVLAMSLAASVVPAFRGAGVDPSVTLRAE
jgi:putative ABC transport system permease protein